MGLLNDLALLSSSKLVIPCVGKMFYSNITDTKSALVVVLNKGYLESSNLEELLTFISGATSDEFIFVGGTDKVKLHSGEIVYRQRVFMHSILEALRYSTACGFQLSIPSDFRVPINSVMNNLDDCYYLERIARLYRQSIDSYLKKVVLVQLYYMAEDVHIMHNLKPYYEKTLARPHLKGLLDYAPFLCSGYSIDKNMSAIFIDEDSVGKDMFYTKAMDYGYTNENIEKLIEGGRLNEVKKRG